MDYKIERCSLEILSKLPKLLNAEKRHKDWSSMFMVAFFIINTMAIEKKSRVKIFRDELADLCCYKNPKSITSITNKLHEIGIIEKDLIGEEELGKTYNFYRINYSKISVLLEQLGEENMDSWNNCTGLKKERMKEYKNRRSKEKKEAFEVAAASSESFTEDGEAPLPF